MALQKREPVEARKLLEVLATALLLAYLASGGDRAVCDVE
jgi:hypothetical protein